MRLASLFKKSPRGFLSDQRGNALVLVGASLGVLAGIMGLAIDMGYAYALRVELQMTAVNLGGLLFVQSNMGNVARETARRLAVGELTAANAPAFATDELGEWGGRKPPSCTS